MIRAAARLALAGLAVAGVAVAAVACGRASADDPDYEIRVASDTTVELGATGSLSVAIVPGGGRTVSGDGPVRLAVSPGDGLAVPRRRYRRGDAADPAAEAPRFDVRVKAVAAGDHQLDLDVRFWLCGPRVCRPIRATRAVTVHVPAPPVDAGPDAPPPVPGDAGVDAGRRRR